MEHPNLIPTERASTIEEALLLLSKFITSKEFLDNTRDVLSDDLYCEYSISIKGRSNGDYTVALDLKEVASKRNCRVYSGLK